MNGERSAQLNGEVDLSTEAVNLLRKVKGLFPSIQSAFPDSCGGTFYEMFPKLSEPIRRPLGHMPRMKPKRRQPDGVVLGAFLLLNDAPSSDVRDKWPVLAASAIDEHLSDSLCSANGENGIRVR